MKDFPKSDKNILSVLIVIFFAFIPFFYMKQGILTVDTGREFYIAERVSDGCVLYKDIFNIYGPFSYMFNAVLFNIFGLKINVLYNFGIFVSSIILVIIYLISREFLNKTQSFLITLLIMNSLCFSMYLYNSIIPYTYAVVYALAAFLISVLFLVKYLKTEKSLFAYLSCLFAGLSVSNKYEFILYIIVLFYSLLFIKKLPVDKLILSFISFILFPVICFSVLMFQGLDSEDIKRTAELFYNMINAPSLKIFYKHFGVFPSLTGFKNIILQNKILIIFSFLPIINTILFLKNIKKIYTDKPLFIFILCSVAASAKSVFFLNVNNSGSYLLPICLIATVILTKDHLKNFIALILCFFIVYFAFENFDTIKYKSFQLNTVAGKIYTFPKDGIPIKTAVDYIINNTDENDSVQVLPEGAVINFLTERNCNNMYHSLIPLYYDDVFGEEKIITDFTNNLPEVIIILPVNTIEYGKRYFGRDYAQKFYNMIKENYLPVENIKKIKIYRKKNNK